MPAPQGAEAKVGLVGRRTSEATEAATKTTASQHFPLQCQPLANKMDELRSQVATNNIIKDSCILQVTETWLHRLIPLLRGISTMGI